MWGGDGGGGGRGDVGRVDRGGGRYREEWRLVILSRYGTHGSEV